MTNTDKIREWIVGQKQSGSLKPGDKLPSYKTFMDLFHISYLTASHTLNKLAREGLVECRRGSGTYLAGGNELTVLLNIHPTTISFDRMRKLLNKHLANADLHLNVELAPVEEINNPIHRDEIARKYKAALSIYPFARNEVELPPADLTRMPDYREVAAGLVQAEGISCDNALPFTFYSYQLGVNRGLLKKIGMRLEQLVPGFDWWEEFVRRCRMAGLLPASFDYMENSVYLFQDFLQLLFSLIPYDARKYEGVEPLFDTPEGHRFLSIIRDSEPNVDVLHDSRSFFHNGAVLHFQLGSWITVQNKESNRPDKEISDLEIVPYRTPDGRKLCFLDPDCLKAYFRHDATLEEQNRVWELMKIMVSREFQMDYCGASGLLSANRAILPTEYFWNRTNRWHGFFPGPEDEVVYGRTRFSPNLRTSLSVLLENYRFFHADASETLRRMDGKMFFFYVQCANPYLQHIGEKGEVPCESSTIFQKR